MTNDMSTQQVKAAKLLAAQRLKLAAFIEESVVPVALPQNNVEENLHATATGYIHRVRGWLRSLGKLDATGDFQAIAAAARSLFEIVVDLTLIQHDPAASVSQMLDWELCVRHQRFQQRLVVFEGRQDERSQDFAKIARMAIALHGERVAEIFRRMKWKKYPSARWTARNLREDATLCDKQLSGSNYGDHYRLSHTELCWNTHGSAFAGIRGLDELSITQGVIESYMDCVLFAREAAKLVLVVLGRFDDQVTARFDVFDRDALAELDVVDAMPAEPVEENSPT